MAPPPASEPQPGVYHRLGGKYNAGRGGRQDDPSQFEAVLAHFVVLCLAIASMRGRFSGPVGIVLQLQVYR